MPVASIASAVADAASRWCDADFPPRVRAQARIAQRVGYSIPVVEFALDHLFGSITVEAIESTIAAEIGTRRVEPIGPVAVISSRTTIGVAVIPAIFALCAGCRVLVKDRADAFVASFFETLAEEDARLGGSMAQAVTWNGEADARDLTEYAAVVAFGGEDALRAIRVHCAPEARFIAYGPKASIGYVTRDSLAGDDDVAHIAHGAARDMLLYDGEGCLSLHVLFVERGGRVAVEDFARRLADAVRSAAVEFPLGAQDAAAAARAAAVRDLAIFRGGPVYSNAEASFVIESGLPDRAPAFAPRAIAVHAVDAPGEMLAYVERHRLPLEACAVAGSRDDAIAAAVAAGANRIARFGEMQTPPLAYAHGGRPRFAEFVRFVDCENA